MNKKILFLILLALILVPSLHLALAWTPLGIVGAAAKNLKDIAIFLAVIAFAVAGIMFLSATGNPSRMTIAKGSLITGVAGIVIVILAANACPFVGTMFGLDISVCNGGGGGGGGGGGAGGPPPGAKKFGVSDLEENAADYATANGLGAPTTDQQLYDYDRAYYEDKAANPDKYARPSYPAPMQLDSTEADALYKQQYNTDRMTSQTNYYYDPVGDEFYSQDSTGYKSTFASGTTSSLSAADQQKAKDIAAQYNAGLMSTRAASIKQQISNTFAGGTNGVNNYIWAVPK